MTHKTLVILLICFHGIEGSLDASLQRKGKGGGEADHSDHVGQVHEGHDLSDHGHDGNDHAPKANDSDHDLSDHGISASDRVANTTITTEAPAVAADVVAPIIRVADSCVIEVTLKDNGHNLKDIDIPAWYALFFEVHMGHFRDKDNHALYKNIPKWTDVDYAIKIQQEGDHSKVTAWYKSVPAGRLYFLIIGFIEVEDESDAHPISGPKDACEGEDFELNFRYLLDIFLTGDDFDKLPTVQRYPIDDLLYTDEDSIVNHRAQDAKFEGKVIEILSDFAERAAWWILDATLLEKVDVLAINRLDASLTAGSMETYIPLHELSSGKTSPPPAGVPKEFADEDEPKFFGYVFNSFFYFIVENVLRDAAGEGSIQQNPWPVFSFWFAMTDRTDHYIDLDEQQDRLFEDDAVYKKTEPSVLFITDFKAGDPIKAGDVELVNPRYYLQAFPGEASLYNWGDTVGFNAALKLSMVGGTVRLEQGIDEIRDVRFGAAERIGQKVRELAGRPGADTFCNPVYCSERLGVLGNFFHSNVQMLVKFRGKEERGCTTEELANRASKERCRCDVDCSRISDSVKAPASSALLQQPPTTTPPPTGIPEQTTATPPPTGIPEQTTATTTTTTTYDPREIKTFVATYNGLFKTFVYDDYSFHLPIVSCGLFPKTIPRPKNCAGKKPEHEAAVW